jgi:hypothetical protein
MIFYCERREALAAMNGKNGAAASRNPIASVSFLRGGVQAAFGSKAPVA